MCNSRLAQIITENRLWLYNCSHHVSLVGFDCWDERLFESKPFVYPIIVDGQNQLVVTLQQKLGLFCRNNGLTFKNTLNCCTIKCKRKYNNIFTNRELYSDFILGRFYPGLGGPIIWNLSPKAVCLIPRVFSYSIRTDVLDKIPKWQLYFRLFDFGVYKKYV